MDESGGGTSAAVLSRPVIEAAALARANRDGLGSLSLRRLAEDLSVTPMALYRHVEGKDDLLQAVADARLSRLGFPRARRSWRGFLFDLAQGLRRLFRGEPELLGLFTRRAVTSAAARARFESAVAVLTRAGFSQHGAVEAYAAVHTYTIGFCALEAGRRGAVVRAGPGEDPVAEAIRSFVSDTQFDVGLHAMLAGLEPSADRSAGRARR